MAISFNDIFNNSSGEEYSIPNGYLSYLNNTVPDGFEYQEVKPGVCQLITESGEYRISGIAYSLNDEQRKVLGDRCSLNDVIKYMNNSQERIEITLKADNTILLNNTPIKLDMLLKDAYHPLELKSGQLWMVPKPFPDPIAVTLSDGTIEKHLMLERMPNRSVDTWTFKTNNDGALNISLVIDMEKQTSKMKLDLEIEKATDVREIVESGKVYQALIEGRGLFMGYKMNAGKGGRSSKMIAKSVVFWEKVFQIEEELGLEFDPSASDIDEKTVEIVEELYQSLVRKEPFKDGKSVESLSGLQNSEKNDLVSLIGKPILFEFETTNKVELFGSLFEVQAIVMIFNAKIKDVKMVNDNLTVLFEDESKEKKKYNVALFFANHEEMNAMKSDRDNMLSMFRNAKLLSEE